MVNRGDTGIDGLTNCFTKLSMDDRIASYQGLVDELGLILPEGAKQSIRAYKNLIRCRPLYIYKGHNGQLTHLEMNSKKELLQQIRLSPRAEKPGVGRIKASRYRICLIKC